MNRTLWPAVVALVALTACTSVDESPSTPIASAAIVTEPPEESSTTEASASPTEAQAGSLDFAWAAPFSLTAPAEWERDPASSGSTLWISGGTNRAVVFTTQGPETVDEWVSTLTSQPRIEVTEPETVEVGGASGFVMDATASSEAAEGGPGVCARTDRCWTIFEDPAGFYSIDEGWTNRIWILDVDGETVLIITDAPDAAFEDWVATVDEALATLEWTD